jgi:hypothetical protein
MSVRIDGVVLLDKPAGMSSQGAVTAVKRAFNAEKAVIQVHWIQWLQAYFPFA